MIKQTYQEVSKVILEELVVNPTNFKKLEHHKYFYDLKLKNPKKYERLTFDTNGAEPYCETLSSIFSDFRRCGFMNSDNSLILDSIKKYLNSKSISDDFL
jgi:hypothetical protein